MGKHPITLLVRRGAVSGTQSNMKLHLCVFLLILNAPSFDAEASVDKPYLPMIERTSRVGHMLSLSSDSFALVALHQSKKPHSVTVLIRKNLFYSYVMLNSVMTSKDLLCKDELSLSMTTNGDINDSTTYPCKVVFALGQCTLLINRALVFATFSSLYFLLYHPNVYHNEKFNAAVYTAAWGLPLVWTMLEFLRGDRHWWFINENRFISILFIHEPIDATAAVNLYIFIKVVWDLRSSTRLSFSEREIIYVTLMIMPTLEVHRYAFSILALWNGKSVAPDAPQLFLNQFFTSYQGLLVALLHWIVNRKVQKEASEYLESRRRLQSVMYRNIQTDDEGEIVTAV